MNSFPYLANVSNAPEDCVLIFGTSLASAAIQLENQKFAILRLTQLTHRGLELKKAEGIKFAHEVKPYSV